MDLLRDIRSVTDRAPAAPCVTSAGGVTAGYATILERAHRVAAGLVRLAGEPPAPVLLGVEHLADRVVVELGCLLAAVPFVPLRPEAPRTYARHVLAELGTAVAVGSAGCLDGLPAASVDSLAGARPLGRERQAGPEDCAYIMFTSGSGGRPKGVAVPRRALDAYCTSFVTVAGLTAADTSLVLAAPDFDVSIEEVFPFLKVGAHLADARPSTRASPAAVVREIARQGATTAFVAPLVLEALFDHDWEVSALRLVRTGGERVVAYPPEAFPVRVLNEYGPTETVVAATCCDLTSWPERSCPPPIGYPLPHVRARLHDPDELGRGELVVGGASVASGYTDPLAGSGFVNGDHGLEYRTGDIVSVGPRGAFLFHGRADRQVQVGGVRLELDAVELAARSHPGVTAAAAAAMTDDHGRAAAVVVGYVASGTLDEAGLRERVAGASPSPDLPVRLCALERLPLDARGKTDHRRVVELATGPGRARTPAGVEDVCRVFSDLLGEPVAAGSSLFACGLTSRTAEAAARKLQEMFGTPCTARDVFLHPVPAEIAEHLQAAPHVEAAP
jgi:non-ribosomal peptide synthetase component F